jgi:multiple sugar transport system substrate-binding protein
MKLNKAVALLLVGGLLTTASVQAKKVTIIWADHERNTKANVEGLIADFEKLNPDINVKWQPLDGWDIDKIITMLTANSAPDVFWTYGEFLAALTENQLTLDLSKYLKTARLDKNLEDMPASLVNSFWVGKRFIAMPKYAGVLALGYNKNMFNMAGVPVPTSDWDWNDIITIGQKLVKKDAAAKTTQYGFNAYSDNLFDMFIKQNGGQIIPKGELLGSKLLVDDAKSIEALKFVHSLIWQYHIMPPTDNTVYSFLGRKCAMFTVGSWDVDMFKTFKDEWNIVEVPKGPTGVRATAHTYDGYVIPKSSKHINESLKFLAYLTSDRGEKWRIKSQPLQPANMSLSKDWEDMVHGIPTNAKLNTQVYLKTMSYAYRPFLLKRQSLVRPIIQSYIEKIYSKNQMSVDKGIQDMVREVNSKISKK